MQIRKLLDIQSAVESDRAMPIDMHEKRLKEIKYFSESTQDAISIQDMHLTHLIRAFIKMLDKRETVKIIVLEKSDKENLKKILDDVKQLMRPDLTRN